tara:strand:+ start:2117 stop:3538 length:1422 start_codon:yes stop_codon:yes gene_type:complete
MTIELDGVNNTLKTDKIEPQSGTALQVGASGDTITLPSGATLTIAGTANVTGTLSNNGTATGFGAVDWQTSDIKTSTFTAVAGKGYFVNTTGGAITVNLPAGSAGAIVALVDYAGTWNSNKCTISANGSEKINGTTTDATFEREREAAQLVYVDSTQGWMVTSDADQGASQKAYIVASGGTESTSGDYKIHTFNSSGTFTVSSVGNAAGGGDGVSYLVLAGGGSGGSRNPGGNGGAGGAGGYREGKNSGDPYSASPLNAPAGLTVSAQGYPITVGAGGTTPGSNPATAKGTQGSTSTFSTISSAGGGFGGVSDPGNSNNVSAGNGGSGGGAAFGPGPKAQNFGAGNTPPVSPPQGNNGGQGRSGGTVSSGAGGGAGAVGTDADGSDAGDGGNGVTSSITGSGVTRGGGGGGASETIPEGDGGSGGGGKGKLNTGPADNMNGTANLGGGGGGGYCSQGGTGGSGVVIIRYKYQN